MVFRDPNVRDPVSGRRVPGPLEILDAVGDVVLHIPRIPAKILSRTGSTISSMGAEMDSAVTGVTDKTSAIPPDPVTVVAGLAEYVIAVPKGAVLWFGEAAGGVNQVLESAQNRLRNLVR